jgi:hypothetical protein
MYRFGGLHPRSLPLVLKERETQPSGFVCKMMSVGSVERWEMLVVKCGDVGDESRIQRLHWCFSQQNTLCHVFDTLCRVSPLNIWRNFW